MEAVLRLRDEHAADGLRGWLQQHGAALQPMHPGATDAEGRRWFLVVLEPGGTPDRLAVLVEQLRARAEVDAAYLKPAGSSP